MKTPSKKMRYPFTLTIFLVLFISAIGSGEPSSEDNEILKILRVEGNIATSQAEILKVLPFQLGDPLTPQKRNLAGKMVLSLLQNNGYLEAKTTSTWRNVNGEGLFLINIQEGPIYRFGDTDIKGLETLPKKMVVIEQTYKKGDPYSRNELLRTQTRLYLTGLVEDIRIQASTTSTKTADITILVTQKKLKWIKGGVGWGSEEKERLTLVLNNKNLWHSAHEIELMGTISRIWREVKLDYVNPYFFHTRTENRTTVSWRAEDREGYDLEQTLGSTGLGRQLTQDIRGNIRYQIERNLTFNVDSGITSIAPERSDTRSIMLTLNRNNTNDPFFPTLGTNTELKLQRAGGFLAGNINFNEAALNARGYHPLWGPFTGALAVRSGVVREFSPSEEVPIFDRFFTGGANSIRGYKERGVGPKDSDDNPLGGEWLLGSSFEVRFPLVWRLTAALFIDGGQVGPESRNVSPSKWKYGGGGGIRFKTPVGPIRLDYGYKLNRDPDDLDPWRIHFSLGESF